MKDYQATKNNCYVLPGTLYKRMLAIIRDYPRRKEEYEHILDETPARDFISLRNTSGMSDITASKAIMMADISREAEAVEKAMDEIPQEYIDGVMNNIMYRFAYPRDADMRTYKRYKQKYIYFVSKYLKLVKWE